ncbi:MAG: hypothetical protein ACPGZP_04260 [Panacagrimonas sp.]
MTGRALTVALCAVTVTLATYHGLNFFMPMQAHQESRLEGPTVESIYAGSVGFVPAASSVIVAVAEGAAATAETADVDPNADPSADVPETPCSILRRRIVASAGGSATAIPASASADGAVAAADAGAASADEPATDSGEIDLSSCPILMAKAKAEASDGQAASDDGTDLDMDTDMEVERQTEPAPEPEVTAAPEVAAPPEAAPAVTAAPEAAPAQTATVAPAPPPVDTAALREAAERAAKRRADPPEDAQRPWWPQTRKPDQLNLVFAGKAAFSEAIVLLFDGDFADAQSANAHISVVDEEGHSAQGKWVVPGKNKKMLAFQAPTTGRYEITVGAELTDANGRSLGEALTGPVYVH